MYFLCNLLFHFPNKLFLLSFDFVEYKLLVLIYIYVTVHKKDIRKQQYGGAFWGPEGVWGL